MITVFDCETSEGLLAMLRAAMVLGEADAQASATAQPRPLSQILEALPPGVVRTDHNPVLVCVYNDGFRNARANEAPASGRIDARNSGGLFQLLQMAVAVGANDGLWRDEPAHKNIGEQVRANSICDNGHIRTCILAYRAAYRNSADKKLKFNTAARASLEGIKEK